MTIELTDDNNSDVTVINGLAFKLCCYYDCITYLHFNSA